LACISCHLRPFQWHTYTIPSIPLALSGHMSIIQYNRNCYFSAMDKCRYMIESVSFAVLQSYFDHTSLVGTVCYTNVFMNVLSASSCHLEVIVWSWKANDIHILLPITAINMALSTAIFLPSRMKKTEI
jgi:hypothetical protein